MKHTDATFMRLDVIIDDNEFDRCLFVDCKLIFSGGHFSIVQPDFQGTVKIELREAAHRTALLCQLISRLPGGDALLAGLLSQAASSFPAAEKLRPQ